MAQLPSPVLETGIVDRSSLTVCPLCKALASRTECFARDELLDRGDFIYRYVKCHSCGLVYLNPLPSVSDYSEIYPSDYPAWSKSRATLFFRHFLMDLPQVWTVKRFKKGGSLLDVGCGMGTFLACLKKQGGWVVEGVEPSSFGCDLARKQFGLSLWHGALDNAPFKENSFDAITLWDVLEHVEDPRATVRTASRLLKKDGVLLISMPNIGSFDYPFFRRRWYFLTAPYHFCLFSLKTATRLFSEEGFVLLARQTTFLSIYDTVFCSLQLVFKKRIPTFLRISLGIVACLIGTPFFLIAHSFNKGPRMVIVAQKS